MTNHRRYVSRVDPNIVKTQTRKVPFTIKVLDSGVPFALPGGFFFIDSRTRF